jgi:hypothetical protein
MRRALSFVGSLSLIGGGAFVLIGHLMYGEVIRGIVLMAAALMLGLGGYWFWADFMGGEPRAKKGD